MADPFLRFRDPSDQTQSIRIRIIEEARTVVKVVYAAFGARLFVDDDYDGTTFKYSIVTS